MKEVFIFLGLMLALSAVVFGVLFLGMFLVLKGLEKGERIFWTPKKVSDERTEDR